MKIYKKIIIDITTDKVLSEESFDYTGEIAQCGSGGGGETVDKEYNRRMAAIAEKQQKMADYYFQRSKGLPQELETAQMKANLGLIPEQVGFERSRMDFEKKGMEYGLEGLKYQQQGLDQGEEWYRGFKPMQEEYFKQSLGGIDVGKRRSEAVAGVEHQFSQMQDQLGRNLRRRGLQAGSSDLRQMAIDKAIAKAGASTRAKNIAETEQFGRLSGAMSSQFRRPQI